MTIPVLLVTGFLGAGKTTFVNAMLARAGGRRIAAIVNDFGAINIDEELIDNGADTIVGLANGCVCCTLQGDLLRTIKLLMARDPVPEHIVIEASGIADPAGILQALQDPVLWKSARLDGVVCVVDALEYPVRRTDELWKAQLSGANFVVLSKAGDLADEAAVDLAASLGSAGVPVIDLAREAFPADVLLGAAPSSGFRATDAAAPLRTDRFAKVEWETDRAISLAGLQAVIGDFAPVLMRAKGVLAFNELPGQSFLLQMVGLRVTLEPMGDAAKGCRLVLIGERARLDADGLRRRLDRLEA